MRCVHGTSLAITCVSCVEHESFLVDASRYFINPPMNRLLEDVPSIKSPIALQLEEEKRKLAAGVIAVPPGRSPCCGAVEGDYHLSWCTPEIRKRCLPPKDALRGVTHYPLPTNEPRPMAKRCHTCPWLTFQRSGICPRCIGVFTGVELRRRNVQTFHSTVNELAKNRWGEQGPGLAARFKGTTAAARYETEMKIVCDNGWNDDE